MPHLIVSALRQFEGFDVEALVADVSAELAREGRSLVGKHASAPTAPALRRAIRAIVSAKGPSAAPDSLYAKLLPVLGTAGPGPLGAGADGTEREAAPATDEAALEDTSAVGDPLKPLLSLLDARSAVAKIEHDRPSTGGVGTVMLQDAFKRFGSSPECPFAVITRLLVQRKGAGGRADIQLSSADDASVVGEQWAALRAAFLQDDTVIIFHLKNHFALVFALREWDETVPDPASSGDASAAAPPVAVTRRQLLTARKGQRPSAWIDWEEARQTMLGWAGYAMFSVTNRAAPARGVSSKR
jgi:hypothetical protein